MQRRIKRFLKSYEPFIKQLTVLEPDYYKCTINEYWIFSMNIIYLLTDIVLIVVS